MSGCAILFAFCRNCNLDNFGSPLVWFAFNRPVNEKFDLVSLFAVCNLVPVRAIRLVARSSDDNLFLFDELNDVLCGKCMPHARRRHYRRSFRAFKWLAWIVADVYATHGKRMVAFTPESLCRCEYARELDRRRAVHPNREPKIRKRSRERLAPIHGECIDQEMMAGLNGIVTLVCHPLDRSEEHTSELQSHVNLVCRLPL